ncbi:MULTISPECIES: GntR family transcriptional regulator [unclassified Aurantimonas]|uniref:GntR family transcriptional regulator n=1 Tax=unclassified Aurantimonas TaxID=2638230 RepID=UPI002E17E8B6|nr:MULTISPECIES: GntR family transcriptional regulator [unclassified Aurantimonas]MEC5292807.1 GntR family transcriptional regulator [Aurantimonas sp. C2-3-R2]MEC5413859.1 GntR family transcriptional regulator [Aurantimonas sp. C2-4-R8]
MTSVVEQATGMIRQAILSGRYGPGERLKVADLSSQFGFSTMPLREALRKLEGEGLVEIEPNRGATVRRLDRRFVEDLFELNAELRVFAIRRSIKTLTLDKLEALEALAIAYKEAIERHDLEGGVQINRTFNACVVEIGGNLEILRNFQRGWELIGAFRLRFGYGEGRQQGIAREKRLLVEALRRQDLQLAEAVIRMQHAATVEDLIQRLKDSGA